MPSTATTVYELNKPVVGGSTDTWGGLLNDNFDIIDQGLVPPGLISMWAGAIGAIPSGWALCDGANGTPNLRDRFIVGAGNDYAVGATGGADSKTTSSNGAHTHSITVNNHTLNTTRMPSHRHSMGYHEDRMWSTGGAGGRAIVQTSGAGSFVQGSNIRSTGGSGAHSHGASSNTTGAHTHTVDVRPRYFALAFIQKLPPA